MLNLITLTGADERTNISDLLYLLEHYPSVELGLLYTATPEGRNRYPSRRWLASVLPKLQGRVALHVCGSAARHELLSHNLFDLTRHTPRVQLNGVVSVETAEAAARTVGTLITQHSYANRELLTVKARNHSLLIDSSGGKGISPEQWTAPSTDKPVGFAGGLGLANLAEQMVLITPLAKAGAWLDMESNLRDSHDWFSASVATSCARLFSVRTDMQAAA